MLFPRLNLSFTLGFFIFPFPLLLTSHLHHPWKATWQPFVSEVPSVGGDPASPPQPSVWSREEGSGQHWWRSKESGQHTQSCYWDLQQVTQPHRGAHGLTLDLLDLLRCTVSFLRKLWRPGLSVSFSIFSQFRFSASNSLVGKHDIGSSLVHFAGCCWARVSQLLIAAPRGLVHCSELSSHGKTEGTPSWISFRTPNISQAPTAYEVLC